MHSIKNPIVVIDGDNQLYRAFFKFARLKNDGKSVAALYGMPKIVSSILKKLKPKDYYLVWDGKKDPRRKELQPEYKRTKTRLGFDKEDAIRQKEVLKNLFEALGVKQVHRHNIEGDDHLYMMVRELRKQGENIIIVSTDKDFRQLISKQVSIWDDRNNILTTKDNCKDLHGYDAHHCVDYLCLTGDKSDNLKGYPGIGDVTALNLLDEYGSIKNILSSDVKIKRVDRKKLRIIYKVMREMVDLRYFYLKNIKGNRRLTIHNEEGKRNKKHYLKICKNHNLKTHQSKKFIKSFRV